MGIGGVGKKHIGETKRRKSDKIKTCVVGN